VKYPYIRVRGDWRSGSTRPGAKKVHSLIDKVYQRKNLERAWEPRLAGRATLVRFADDLVIIFEHERDARRVFDVLPKRMAKYGLTLHPEKTRLIDFRRPGLRVSASPDNNGDACSRPAPSTCWGSPITGPSPARDTGWWSRRRRLTASGGLRIADWCRRYRHEPVREQWTALKRKLLGHFGYFGITGNYLALQHFSVRVIEAWRKWLSRRSQRAWISREKMKRLLERYPLPQPRIRISPVT
jgi:RNA-directed DNA polymerase